MSSANPSIYGAQFVARMKSPPGGGSWLATALILGITITSGVCLLTFGLSRPIFANETFASVQVEEISKQELGKNGQWELSLAKKYPKLQINYPTDGIAHIKTTRYIKGRPIRINLLEVNPSVNENLVIKPQTASDTLLRRAQISNMVNRSNSIVAINAGYFKPDTGAPLGTLMIDGKMLTGPIYNRVAMGIAQRNDETAFVMDRVKLLIEVQNKSFTLKADNINQPRMLSTYTLIYTPEWGNISPPAPRNGSVMAIENGKMVAVSSSAGVKIPKHGFVVSAPLAVIQELVPRRNLKLKMTLPKDFKNTQHIISGGPYLVKEGRIFIDTKAQKLNAISGKNPRSAIGYTKEGTLIMAVVDGREKHSVGMTLGELAIMMASLGCEYAMNLDGGSSSVMYVNGRIVNSPVQQGGIPISNALVVSEKQISVSSL